MADSRLPVPHVTAASPQEYAAIPQAYASPGISLQQIFSIVWAYRRITIGVVLAAVVIAVIVTKLSPRSYQATATLMVNYEVNDPLGGKDFPVGLMGSYMSTQIQLIKSPAILMPVVDRLDLANNEDYVAGFDGEHGTAEQWAKDQLARKLIVDQGEWGSQLIYIGYVADSAPEAARVANTVAEVYAEQQSQRLNGPASERGRRYTEQLKTLRAQVDEAQNQLTEFRQRTGLLGNEDDIDLALERLSNLQQRLLEAQQQHRAAEAALIGAPGTRNSVVDSPSVRDLRSEIASKRARLAELQTTLGPRHPQIIELQSQLASAQGALNAETQVYTGNAQTQVDSARKLEAQLSAAVDAERAKVLKHRKLVDESAQYELALKSAQTLYERALDGYDQIALSSGGDYNNVSTVSEATPPVKPTKPKPLLNLAAALVLGGFFGLIGPMVYEFFFRRVRCRDDFDRDFGVPVLVEFGPHPMGASA